MFLRKKQKPQLTDAIHMLGRATEIVYNYKWNKDYVPGPEDVKLLERFEQGLRESQCITGYVLQTLTQKVQGEELPEMDAMDSETLNGFSSRQVI